MARSCVTTKRIVYLALAGDVLIFGTKLAAAMMTGSSSMLSEAVHTLVDTANEALLLYGYRRAERPPDIVHPLGYGRELYFWSFIVALMLFGFGAGVALLQGWHHIVNPQPIENPAVNYIVLAFSFVFEAVSWAAAFRQLRATRGDLSYWQAVHRSKDPPSFMVLFEDSASLIGILVAALGIFLATTFNMPVLDGVASVIIGIVLAVVAAVLARESKSLLIGERASPVLVAAAVNLAMEHPGVLRANGAITVHLAPDQIVVALSIEFKETLLALEIEDCVAGIEHRIREMHPEIVVLFIKPQTAKNFEAWRSHRYGAINI